VDDIEYINRLNGRKEIEKVYGRRSICLIYGETLVSRIVYLFFSPFLKLSWLSKFYGYLQKRPASAKKIDSFIETFQIDKTEFLETNFRSFNDFFIRKLKPEKRPLKPDPEKATLPADGRYLVFPNLNRAVCFYVKGQKFDLTSFLCDFSLSKKLEGGAMMIARLCPTDYHRFHFPCSGRAGEARLIEGSLFSVNPLALRKNLRILSMNKRMVTEIETEKFGTIFYVEVGATFVGSIHQTYVPHAYVNKGDEKGYFAFGGSCLVLFFEKNRICFDSDLIVNSEKGIETKGLFGSSLGRCSPV